MILAAGHALISARRGGKADDDDLSLRVIALPIGGIEQKRRTEDSRAADHGRARVSDG
jgi:hypothetical protein